MNLSCYLSGKLKDYIGLNSRYVEFQYFLIFFHVREKSSSENYIFAGYCDNNN